MADHDDAITREELAERLGCHPNTLITMVKKWRDFPIIERGSKGRPWLFPAKDAVAFVQARRAEVETLTTERHKMLADRGGAAGVDGSRSREDENKRRISLDEEIKAAKLRQLQRDELKESGFLAPTHEVRGVLERAFRRFGHAMTSAIEQVARRYNLPDAVTRSIELEIGEMRTAFVQQATQALLHGENTSPAS